MNREIISTAIGNINHRYIDEAEFYSAPGKRITRIKSFFVRAPIAAVLLICLLISMVAYGTVSVHKWSSSITFDDGSQIMVTENATCKRIPETTPKTYRTDEGPGTLSMTHAEVEQALGFHILNYDLATSDTMGYTTFLNPDGSIGRIDLWWADFLYESEERYLTLRISMLGEQADEGYVAAFQEGLDATGGKVLENTVTVQSLDTKVIVYANDWSESRLTAAFVYDNVFYEFTGENYSESEILTVIESLK